MKVQVCPKGKMKKFFAALAGALILAPALAHASPSTTFWAPSTPYIQPYGWLHITYDTYYRNKVAFPVDTGLTLGVLPFDKIQAEVGFDLLYPTAGPSGPLDFPLFLNGKLGSPEGALFEGSPGWSAGMYNIGFKSDVTDYNIAHFMLGKTIAGWLPQVGFSYATNDKLVADDQFGIMAGLFAPAIELKKPYMEKLVVAADIQTGKNALGAAGGGVYFYFTPMISLLTGPVYFLEKSAQAGTSQWIWTMQLDVDMDMFSKKAE